MLIYGAIKGIKMVHGACFGYYLTVAMWGYCCLKENISFVRKVIWWWWCGFM